VHPGRDDGPRRAARGGLDGEPDREAVLAGFVTALPPGVEQVLRALLDAPDTGLPQSTDTGEGRTED
jgi:hypothetical protein